MSCLILESPDLILDAFVDSAQALGICNHGWGLWNPCRISDLWAGESIRVDCVGGDYHPETVHTEGRDQVLIQFSFLLSILPLRDRCILTLGWAQKWSGPIVTFLSSL